MLFGSPVPKGVAFVSRYDLMSLGVNDGNAPFTSAAAPATVGDAADVPVNPPAHELPPP